MVSFMWDIDTGQTAAVQEEGILERGESIVGYELQQPSAPPIFNNASRWVV